MDKLKFATVWLGGCSGCHMSFLDLDEWLIDLSEKVQLVYSPVMDTKRFPDAVDVALVEGAIANEENREMAHRVRASSRYVISFGDCAVTGNVTASRNPLGLRLEVLRSVFLEGGDLNPRIPDAEGIVPPLVDRVVPLHQEVPVDFYLPGCPPPANRIRLVLEALVEGRTPVLPAENRTFG